jgi:hypothetical protein
MTLSLLYRFVSKDRFYINDVLSPNNSRFGDFVDRVYPIELEIKGTTDICDLYFDLHLAVGSGGRLITKHYDERDDFNFTMVKFPFKCSKIPAAPAYGDYISQLMRYSRACGYYQDFLDRGLLLTRKLLKQGFTLVKVITLKVLRSPPKTWLTVMEYQCHK